MAVKVKMVKSCASVMIAVSVLGAVIFSVIANDSWAQSEDSDHKLGTIRTLPSLQTRAQPPLQPDTLHLGMLETQFFAYAKENNWAAIASVHRGQYTMHQLQPGGEGLYTLPDRQLVYVRGFMANIYFEGDRLVGMRLISDNRDRPLTASELLNLVRAWFPDDMVSVIYQVAPSDQRKSIVETLIGTIPKAFEQDLGKISLPFCRAIVFPSPIPVNALSTCNSNI